MKKIFTLIVMAIAAIATPAMAGDWYLGGNVGFMHRESNAHKINEFSIQPEVGYNFSDRWAVGGQIGYLYRNTYNVDPNVNLNLFTINPYARFSYFRTSNNLIQLFIDGSVGLGIGSTSAGGNSSTACTYEIGLKPGIAVNITDHFSVVAHLGFVGYHGANNKAKAGGEEEYGGINFHSNNLNFGFYYTF